MAAPPALAAQPVFGTGDIARLCHVAPRTASKWIDQGLLKGYRLPGSRDRRVVRADLIAFLIRHKMPLGELESGVGDQASATNAQPDPPL